MHTTFNSASLAKLSKSQLYALLAEYRAMLSRSGEAYRPAIQAQISRIEHALSERSGP